MLVGRTHAIHLITQMNFKSWDLLFRNISPQNDLNQHKEVFKNTKLSSINIHDSLNV